MVFALNEQLTKLVIQMTKLQCDKTVNIVFPHSKDQYDP